MTDASRERSSREDLDAAPNARDIGASSLPKGAPTGSPVEGGTPDAITRQIGEAARKADAATSGSAREAIERATAPNGKDPGKDAGE